MNDTQKYLIESIQWLKDHNEPIPPDLLSGLKKAGIEVDEVVSNADALESLKKEIDILKDMVKSTPMTKEDFVSIFGSFIEILKASPAPVVNVDAAKVNVPATVVNVPATKQITKEDMTPLFTKLIESIKAMPVPKTPKIKKEIQTIKRDKEGYITSTETTIEYE